MKKRLIIVDISSFIFRAFYAVRLLHSPDGTPVNAIHGVLSMMLKLLEKYQPTHMILARDAKGGSFRNELYTEYKANRSEPPEELVPQFSLIAELVNKMGLPNFILENYEADDIIGSVAVQWGNDFDEILIASGDKDLMQFVNDKVKMVDTMKDKIYDRDGVFEKMGVWPEQIMDYLSMVGDASDNIPGMRGIGAKGAAKLLAEYKTLENCFKNKAEFTNKRVKNAFENHKEDAELSKSLINIVTDLNLEHTPEETILDFYPSNELLDFLRGLVFKTSLKILENIKYTKDQESGGVVEDSFQIIDEQVFDGSVVADKDIDTFIDQINGHKLIAIDAAFNDPSNLLGLVSLGVSFDGESSFYIPIGHVGDEDLLGGSIPNIKESNSLKIVKALVAKDKMLVGSRLKKFFAHCFFLGIEPKCEHFDNVIAHYLADTSTKQDIPTLSEIYLQYAPKFKDDKNHDYSGHDFNTLRDITFERVTLQYRLASEIEKKITELEVKDVYDKIENPLTPVLARIESIGVSINKGVLKDLEIDYSEQIEKIKKEIEKITGEGINLNSPKQVGVLLFEKLNLPVIKRTKTGFSTDAEVLTELDSRNLSPIPGLIVKNRELEKLLSTYIRVLPNLAHPKTNKIHTHLNQAVAATGRLSSDRPNLQNIPIRTEYGRKIRKAFVASPGKLLLACDYSQVELRLLAHFSKDKTMVKAFNEGLDIHAQTASEVLGIALDQVTKEERSAAKAVNFGLMYGQSSFGLSKALRISRAEAKEYITGYFEKFGSVKGYLDSLKDLCAELGYTETLYGRKRFLPDINSQNRTIRSQAERMAINSPIQGTAADIIKLAMINIEHEMLKQKLQSQMVLQVHDELIFEVVEDELPIMKDLVVTLMENVTKLSVPLKVDMGIGVNWYDLK